MINSLPLSLVQAAQDLVETQDVLEACKDCGAVLGTCIHTDNSIYEESTKDPSPAVLKHKTMKEDNLTALDVPDENAPEKQLSGEKEEIFINPKYLTFTPRKPF